MKIIEVEKITISKASKPSREGQ